MESDGNWREQRKAQEDGYLKANTSDIPLLLGGLCAQLQVARSKRCVLLAPSRTTLRVSAGRMRPLPVLLALKLELWAGLYDEELLPSIRAPRGGMRDLPQTARNASVFANAPATSRKPAWVCFICSARRDQGPSSRGIGSAHGTSCFGRAVLTLTARAQRDRARSCGGPCLRSDLA